LLGYWVASPRRTITDRAGHSATEQPSNPVIPRRSTYGRNLRALPEPRLFQRRPAGGDGAAVFEGDVGLGVHHEAGGNDLERRAGVDAALPELFLIRDDEDRAAVALEAEEGEAVVVGLGLIGGDGQGERGERDQDERDFFHHGVNLSMGLDGVELIMAYEEAFGVSISDGEAARIVTPRDVIDLLAARRPDLARAEIAARVREITLEQLGGVDYGEDKRFAADMGVD
jgi:hypothetical protein